MLQFKGTYVFKENGVEIAKSENLITNSGRKIIMQYLAGARQSWASDLAIGAMNIPATALDTQLGFETFRSPIVFKTFSLAQGQNPDLLAVRATLPSSMYANIYEVGVYPESVETSVSNRSNAILTDFYSLENWTSEVIDDDLSLPGQGIVQSTIYSPQGADSPRIGQYSITVPQNTRYQNNTFFYPFDNYTEVDTLDLLVDNTLAGELKVTLSDTTGNTCIVTYQLTENTEYHTISAPFPESVKNLTSISSITIETDATSSLTIDAIKASDTAELSSNDYLISKSILDVPIAKKYNTTLDVEYYIQVL